MHFPIGFLQLISCHKSRIRHWVHKDRLLSYNLWKYKVELHNGFKTFKAEGLSALRGKKGSAFSLFVF